MSKYPSLIYEKPRADIARIWLNKPDTRNAQDTAMLDELNAAFDEASADDEVKVIILAAKGPHFSSGHDLREADTQGATMARELVGTWREPNWDGVAGHYCREKEIYEHYCRRWRDLAKPTVVAVQGKVIAGGLMLVWPFDFVIASQDATFQDNTIMMGIPGVEYFAHIWELGIRRGKEFLMTGAAITAEEAHRAGMVNRVVARDDLEAEAMKFAENLAAKPAFAMKLAKDAANAIFAATGFDNVQRGAFNAHHLAHAHYRLHQDNSFIDRDFMRSFKEKTNR